MKRVYISECAHPQVMAYLQENSWEIIRVKKQGPVYEAIASHPDIFYGQVNGKIIPQRGDLGQAYPDTARYNGVQIGHYFLHNFSLTSSVVIGEIEKAGLVKVHVSQGYTRCNVVPVDSISFITEDRGIAKAATAAGMSVLVVDSGHVRLNGVSRGFLGGASGCFPEEVLFHGCLMGHPQEKEIRDFIEHRGKKVKVFPSFPLEDVGGILVEDL